MGGVKRVYVLTNGCPENRIDAARMLEFLKHNGWKISDSYRSADLILFNTCGHTQGSEESSLRIIRHINATKDPSARFIVCGCLTKINLQRLREIYGGEIFGSDDIQSLGRFVRTEFNTDLIQANYLVPSEKISMVTGRYLKKWSNLWSLRAIAQQFARAYMIRLNEIINVFRPHTFCIKVSTGCLSACSYCAIRQSRGRLHSKHSNHVKREFEEGLRQGKKEFALIGTDLGAYGRDLGTDLVELLKELVGFGGEYSIRLRNIHPKFLIEMMPRLCEVLHSGRIAYLSTAVESGSDRILKAMNRGYTIEQYKEAIRTLNKEFPDIEIRTQFMVGFPGEKEEDFQASLRVLDEVSIDYVEIYEFEARPNTIAERMEDQVPRRVVKKRALQLLLKSLFNERERRRKAIQRYRNFRKR